jgi:hypothetical protein
MACSAAWAQPEQNELKPRQAQFDNPKRLSGSVSTVLRKSSDATGTDRSGPIQKQSAVPGLVRSWPVGAADKAAPVTGMPEAGAGVSFTTMKVITGPLEWHSPDAKVTDLRNVLASRGKTTGKIKHICPKSKANQVLKVGDEILSIDGVDLSRHRSVPRKIGEVITYKIKRDGQTFDRSFAAVPVNDLCPACRDRMLNEWARH